MTAIACQSVRQLLETQPHIENPSLFYEKLLLPDNYRNNSKDAKEDGLKSLTQMTQKRTLYGARSKELWRQLRHPQHEHLLFVVGRLKSPLAINLADGLLENAGIALDRTLGAPYIPGAALKGCCAHAAYWMVEEQQLEPPLNDFIFGCEPDKKTNSDASQGRKGAVDFFPVQPLDIQLGLEILTPHPRENGNERDPIPNKYPIVKAGSQFLFLMRLNALALRQDTYSTENILTTLEGILMRAFDLGFGAKTSSGLGWFERDTETEKNWLEGASQEIARQQEQARKAEAEREAQRRRQEAQAKEEENRKRKEEEARQQQAALEKASPEERLRMELEKMPSDDLLKRLRAIENESEANQRIILAVFKEKSSQRQKRLLRDKKAKAAITKVAQSLGITL